MDRVACQTDSYGENFTNSFESGLVRGCAFPEQFDVVFGGSAQEDTGVSG